MAQDSHSVAGQLALNKKQGVSGQSVSSSAALTITTVDKDFHTKNLIKEAIQDNDFLKNLTSSQMRDITDAMHEKKIPKGCYVIREGGWRQYTSCQRTFAKIR